MFYESIDEKKRYLEIEIIDDEDALQVFLKKIPYWKHSFFRGVNESKFKLFNSLQRNYMNLDIDFLYNDTTDFLKAYIDFAKEKYKSVFENYFKAIGLYPIPDVGVFSFLQHYGAATPFLDWTKNPNIALYFAAESTNIDSVNNLQDCQNYITLYKIDEVDLLNHTLEKSLAKQYLSVQDYVVEYFSKEINLDVKDMDNEVVPWLATGLFEEKYRNEYLSIEKLSYKRFSLITDISKVYKFKLYTQNNFNIVNQEGSFIFNSTIDKPLEEVVFDTVNEKIIKAYEINKRFIPTIIHYINNLGISKDYIYPNPESIATDISQSFKKKFDKKAAKEVETNFISTGVISNDYRCRKCKFEGGFSQLVNESKASNYIQCPKCFNIADLSDERVVKGYKNNYEITFYALVPDTYTITAIIAGEKIFQKGKIEFSKLLCGDDVIWVYDTDNCRYRPKCTVYYAMTEYDSKIDLSDSLFEYPKEE